MLCMLFCASCKLFCSKIVIEFIHREKIIRYSDYISYDHDKVLQPGAKDGRPFCICLPHLTLRNSHHVLRTLELNTKP